MARLTLDDAGRCSDRVVLREPLSGAADDHRVGTIRWDQPRTPARLRASVVTFGLTGRLVCTGVVVLVLWWIADNGGPFVLPALPAAAWVIRDTWGRAPELRAPARGIAPELGGVTVGRLPGDAIVADAPAPDLRFYADSTGEPS